MCFRGYSSIQKIWKIIQKIWNCLKYFKWSKIICSSSRNMQIHTKARSANYIFEQYLISHTMTVAILLSLFLSCFWPQIEMIYFCITFPHLWPKSIRIILKMSSWDKWVCFISSASITNLWRNGSMNVYGINIAVSWVPRYISSKWSKIYYAFGLSIKY